MLRTDIISALDELIVNEAGTSFQALAVVLAKQKWPDLIASEWHNDGGLDAYAPGSLADGKKARGVASSITCTLGKITSDARRAKENYHDLEILVFATPQKVTALMAQQWAEEVRRAFGLGLQIISREDIITSLMLPSNESLCGTLPGIRVPVEEDESSLLARVREAIADEAATWRARQRAVYRPIIPLSAVRLDGAGKETLDTMDINLLRVALTESRRISLEAPGGGGKTTMLVQLATEGLRAGELLLLIDLPAWTRQRVGILEYLARARPFLARNITAADLARLAGRQHFSFLLNGWNEIAETHSEDAIIALSELEHSFPAAGIIVATRTHHISPPLPGAFRTKLLPLNRAQRASYLRQTLDSGADELRIRLESNRVLDQLTRTPLILAEVVTIFQSGAPVPSTRIEVLGAVVKLMEASAEHRSHLQASPLSSRADYYLTHLAAHMTASGEVIVGQQGARRAIHSAASALPRSGQTAVNDPDLILHALTAHHVLEQIDYPSVTFRFQHQQFQEFYAARFLTDALVALPARSEEQTAQAFAARYINMPMWEQPLLMVAEEIQQRIADGATGPAALALGNRLIALTLPVDPILAGKLCCICGSAVWTSARTTVGKVLRDWYSVGGQPHARLALAAMLATGSEDFRDVLVPLLTDTNRQVRLGTYDAGEAFHVTSLGSDWRRVVEGWDEDARADFVYEVLFRGTLAEIGESFAIGDPSAKVRKQAIEGLSWISATDALIRLVNALSDSELDAVLPAFFRETIPDALRPRFIAANRRLVARESTPIARIRRLFAGREVGDVCAASELLQELADLKAPLDEHAPQAIAEALSIVQKHDPEWVSTWVAARLLDRILSGDQWKPFLRPVAQQQLDELVGQVATRELQYGELAAVRMIISSSSSSALAAQVFARLRTVYSAISAGNREPRVAASMRQLRDILDEIPVDMASSGIAQAIGGQFDDVTFEALVDIYGGFNADAEDLRSVLSVPVLQVLRRYIKEGIRRFLVKTPPADDTGAHAALALAKIGDPEDLVDLQTIIEADIARQRAEPRAMTYANWFVEALLLLAPPGLDAALIDLMGEPRYEEWASRGLLRLAMPPRREKWWLGNKTNFEAIWEARAGRRPPGFDAARAKRYAQAIRQRIDSAGGPQEYTGRIKTLAFVLAMLDGPDSKDHVIDALALPGQWDAYPRMYGIRALLESGTTIPLDSMLTVLEPAIEHTLSQGIHNDQNASLLVDCLELLPFSDDPARGMARVDEAVGRVQHWSYQFRELITVLGYTRSEAAVPFLLKLARERAIMQHASHEWIEALGRLNVPAARNVLLSFIDPLLPSVGVDINVDYRNTETLATLIAGWAREDPGLRHRLLALSEGLLTGTQSHLLPAIYRELAGDDIIFGAANLLQAAESPYSRGYDLEAQFLERRAHGRSGAFVFVPRDASRVRAELFQVVLNDPGRRRSAFVTLGMVEVWRIEHGRPTTEPRHPMIESGVPWPPLSLMG